MVTKLEDRTCGKCIACCVVLTISSEELQKPAGVVCPKCTGTACSIYDRRPVVCRNYLCVWRMTQVLEDDARPDLLGVMFYVTRDPQASDPLARYYIFGIPLNEFPDYAAEPVKRVISRLSRERIPIWLKWGDIRRCIHPSKEIRDALASPQAECAPRLTDEVLAWRAALDHASASNAGPSQAER